MENKLPLSDEALLELLTLTVEIDEIGARNWYNKDGQLHRVHGPAVEYSNGDKEYWANGKLHRTDGPAIINTAGAQWYFLYGKQHRADGPAFIRVDGYQEYWINGKQVEPF